jgi:hypothetical protein
MPADFVGGKHTTLREEKAWWGGVILAGPAPVDLLSGAHQWICGYAAAAAHRELEDYHARLCIETTVKKFSGSIT